jgi:membrane-associated phospholipid phosphatase
MLGSDFRYLANNLEADFEDVLTAPAKTGSLLKDRRSYWAVLLTGAAIVGSVALIDEPARNALNVGNGDHASKAMQGNAALMLWGATAALYAYGLGAGESRAREVALTTLQSVTITSLITGATKVLVGRARPKQNQGARAFGVKGRSFLSSATTPAFALATGLSEYWDNRWYMAVPAYGAASAVGLARMRRDAHWFSDVLVSAMVGIGTTKMLLHMHDEHARNPSRFHIFPMVSAGGVGVGASYEWGGDPELAAARLAPIAKPPAARASLAMPANFDAWMAYQQGAFMKPVLDGSLRWDPRYPELDFGLAAN